MNLFVFGPLVIFSWLGITISGFGQGAKYDIPEVKTSAFGEDSIEMADFERKDLAEHLASFVVNHIAKDVIAGDAKAISLAERLNGLALHLNTRNRTALVSDFQFRRDILPKTTAEDFKPIVLAAHLVTRAGVLAKNDGENLRLAGYLYSLAVDIDPTNESAVYKLLMWERDGKKIDWTPIVGS